MSWLQPKRFLQADEVTTPIDPATAPSVTPSTDSLRHLQRFQNALYKAGTNKSAQLVSNITHYNPSDSMRG
jgi:hypothetical protein